MDEKKIRKARKPRITKAQIKKVLKYVATSVELERLRGMRDYFSFDIKSQIEWIDSLEGKEFHSKHYAPLVNEPIPYLKRGTIIYDDFWDEQDDRCINGYAPIINGVQYPRITGPHYFYLNMFQIMMLKVGAGKKSLDFPYYRVLDHLIFLELEKAAKDGYGIIVGKARRMGLSYIGSLMVLWNMLFFKDNTVAVGAGKEDKALALFDKVVKSLQNIREEYRVSYKKTKDILKFKYEITEHKVRKDRGVGSQLDVRTFFSDPSAFEGGSYSFFIFEEIGLHENLIKSYKASEPCFMEGQTQFGLPFLFGTGGEVDKGSRDFKIIWSNPSAYNMKKIFVPAYMYYPGTNEEEETDDEFERGVNFFDVRTGMTDEKAALEHIMKRRVRARKSKEGYVKEVQSRPIKESDLFLKTSGGLLNRIALSAQRESIYNNENKHTWERGRYDWQDTEEIRLQLARCRNTKEKNLVRIKHNIKVKFVEDSDGHVYKLKGFEPINREGMLYNPDIIGTDSYDEQGVVESSSMGASIVYRTFNGISNDYDLPIAFVHERGDGTSEDSFWDNCLKESVFWRAENLIEYTKTRVIGYFQDVYADKYLRVNPNLRKDIVTNRGKQTYGVRMTGGPTGIKSLVTTLLKLEVKENVQNIHFEQLIDDLIEYGDTNTDLAMAYGVVLVHKLDIFDYVSDDLLHEVDEGDVLMDMAYYTTDSNGNLKISTYGNNIDDGLEKLEVFDPRKHLDGPDRENYLNFVAVAEKKRLEERKKNENTWLENKMNKDILDSSVKSFINNLEKNEI